MIRCFGGGFREDSRADEVARLKHLLHREEQQRQAAQAQLNQEQAKCALLEQEILQASQAAHEMGESLRRYFSQTPGSECSDATATTMRAWAAGMADSAGQSAEPSLAADTPRSTPLGHYTSTSTNQQLPAGMQQSAHHDTSAACDQAITSARTAMSGYIAQGHSTKPSSSRLGTNQDQKAPHSLLQQHMQQRQAMQTPPEHRSSRSSYSSSHAALHCSSQQSAATEFSPQLSRQPTLGRGGTARMQRRVLQVADQLKGLAVSWQQRLDDCQPLPCSSPTKPAMITISDAAAAAARGKGFSGTTQGQPTRSVHAVALAQDAAAGAAAARRPAGCSEEWGSSSCRSSSATAVCAYDASCELSSSVGSFARYRSSQQPAYGESPTDISEGDEDGKVGGVEQQQADGSDGSVTCETDEEAEAAQLRWHVQQPEEQHLAQHQQQLKRQLPSHSQLQQHAQQQVMAKHAQWQQQQQQVGLGSFARPAHDTMVPGCAITRNAASRAEAFASDSSSEAMQHGTLGAVAVAAADAVARLPLAAGAPGGNNLRAAPRMAPQQQVPFLQQDQQQTVHSYKSTSPSWQQQQQQHSSPFPSLSGTSCSGTPAVQRQRSLRGGAAAGAGVEHIPQELKSMAPLRRHQQYLGTT